MAASQSGPKRRWFSFRQVEEAFDAPEPVDEPIDGSMDQSTDEPVVSLPVEPVLTEEVTAALGSHVAQLLSRFEEVVEVAKQEAAAEAARVVERSDARALEVEEEVRQLMTKGRDLAASTFAEAERRYAEAVAAKDVAVRRINEAVDQLRSALASLEAIPPFPVLEVPVPRIDDAGEPVPFRAPVAPMAAALPAAPFVMDDEDEIDWSSADLGDVVTPVSPAPVEELAELQEFQDFQELQTFEDVEPATAVEQEDERVVVTGPATSAADELQQLLRDLGGSA